ncbi:MAG: hypothetical protein AB7S38_38225 [Vulcanimicrobiota bacterium]
MHANQKQLSKQTAVYQLQQRARLERFSCLASGYEQAACCLENVAGETLDDIYREAHQSERSWSKLKPWIMAAFWLATCCLIGVLAWAAGATSAELMLFAICTPFLGVVAASIAAGLCHDQMVRSNEIQQACGTAWRLATGS